MSWQRPTLSEINARIQADIIAGFGVSSVLRRSFIAVLSRAYAGACFLIYGFIDWVSRQTFPDTAEGENLLRWCSLFGIERNSGQYSYGAIEVTWNGGVSESCVPLGTKFQSKNGQTFTTVTGPWWFYIPLPTTRIISVQADYAGEAGNVGLGETLSLVSPIAGMKTDAVVTTALTGGVDQESEDSMRSRLINRLRNPPQGGAKSDYEQWALSVAGVTRVWVFGAGEWDVMPGNVKVLWATDDAPGGSIPDANSFVALNDYISAKKPMNVNFYPQYPVAYPINFSIQLWPSDDLTKANVKAEIEDLIRRRGGPSDTIFVSHIHESISGADGEERHNLTVPSADIVIPAGKLGTLGTITWVPV